MLPIPALSLALAGLELPKADLSRAGGVAERFQLALAMALRLGLRSVQLNAAEEGLRPRELTRSGRRDLAARLRRQGLAVSGADLWIPPEHFVRPELVDRAVGAVQEAIEFIGEVSRLAPPEKSAGILPDGEAVAAAAAAHAGRATPRAQVEGGLGNVLSLCLPRDLGRDVHGALAATAERHGVRVGDHTWFSQPPPAWFYEGPCGPAIDPAGVLMGGGDPVSEVAKLAGRLVSARYADVNSLGRRAAGGSRWEGGRLDVASYAAILATTGYAGWVVLDLRQVPDPERAAARAIAAWEEPMPLAGLKW